MRRRQLMTVASLAGVLAVQLPALGGGHTWRVNEIFSNSDGTIMFIELTECCGMANELGVSSVTSLVAGNTFFFPGPLTCVNCTANAKILLATAGFAALPGAPTPDHIIADNFFSNGVAGDTVSYSTWHHLDPVTVPRDGNISLQWVGIEGDFSSFTTFNSPTNFAGDTAFVSARCSPSDLNDDGEVGIDDFLKILGDWGPCANPCAADSDLSGDVGIDDFLLVLAEWGTSACP